jgi:hypothetical protein
MLIAEEFQLGLSEPRMEHVPPDEKSYGNRSGGCRQPETRMRSAARRGIRSAKPTKNQG